MYVHLCISTSHPLYRCAFLPSLNDWYCRGFLDPANVSHTILCPPLVNSYLSDYTSKCDFYSKQTFGFLLVLGVDCMLDLHSLDWLAFY